MPDLKWCRESLVVNAPKIAKRPVHKQEIHLVLDLLCIIRVC